MLSSMSTKALSPRSMSTSLSAIVRKAPSNTITTISTPTPTPLGSALESSPATTSMALPEGIASVASQPPRTVAVDRPRTCSTLHPFSEQAGAPRGPRLR